ncbi:hypothetical protein [Shouchella patagoniensis]|uniref:alpha/beta hydrolase n=1 Tax=Shouchella patagoniensis TaxID=228576 RepID=UPI000994AAF2|nr:hypothetical protein [Shouchella patagoniensis]
MGITRYVREVDRLEKGGLSLVISIYYPIEKQTSSKYMDLYEPAKKAALTKFLEMGVREELIKSLETTVANANAKAIEKHLPLPIVLLSPGIGIDRDMYQSLIEPMILAGNVVVTVGHVCDTYFTVMPDGELIDQAKHIAELDYTNFKALTELVHKRVKDLQSVLDQLKQWNEEDEVLNGLFSFDTIIGVGHSLGGAALIELARVDKRICSIISLDGSLHVVNATDPLPVALLNMRQEESSFEEMKVSLKEPIARELSKNQQRLFSLTEKSVYMKVKGADHLTFSDVPTLFELGQFSVRKARYKAFNTTILTFMQSNSLDGSSELVKKIDCKGVEIK